MKYVQPRLASEKTAAKILDMTPGEFRGLVDGGHLPGPRDLGGLERWDVEELVRVASGEALDGGPMEW